MSLGHFHCSCFGEDATNQLLVLLSVIINFSFYTLLIETNTLQYSMHFSMFASKSHLVSFYNMFSIPFIKKLTYSQITYKPGNGLVAEAIFKTVGR